MFAPSCPFVPFQCLKRRSTTSKTPFTHHCKEVSPQQVKKESPSHMDMLLCSPLWEKHVIRHQVEVAEGLGRVLPPQHVETQLDAQHTIQVDDSPFEAKVGHTVKVIGSHRHFPFNNIKGMGNIPPPLNEALHQGSAHRPFLEEANDGLEACFLDVGPGFRNKKVVSFHHFVGTSPTNVWG